MGDRTVVFIGLVVAGLADALANAAGFHVQEESEELHSRAEVWKGTALCFLATGATFTLIAIPVLLFPLRVAIHLNWGLSFALLAAIGLGVDRGQPLRRRAKRVAEYVVMGAAAALLCYWMGRLAKTIIQ